MEAVNRVTMTNITSTTSSESKWRPWIVCFVATLFVFFEFMQGHMFNSLAPSLMRAFQLDAQGLAFLTAVYFVANVIFLYPAGFLLDRYSTRKIILFAMWIAVTATFLISMSVNTEMLFFCRFLTGIGSAFCVLSCFRLASRWFPARRMALMTGLIITVGMAGGMMAQEPLNLLIENFGWRQALIVDGTLGLIFIALIACYVKDYPETQQTQIQKEQADAKKVTFVQGIGRAYFKVQNVAAALFTCFMNTPIIIIGALAGGIFLQQVHQLSSHEAATISMGVFAGTIVGGPIVGWISDKIQLRRLPMLICAVLSFISVLAIMYATQLNVWQWFGLFFILGFFSSAQILSYPTVAESNPVIITAIAVSTVSIITQGGAAILQSYFGYLLKQNWAGQYADQIPLYSAADYHYAFLIIPIGFIVAFVAALIMKETHCRPHSKS